MDNVIVKMFKESGMSIREFADAAGLKYSTAHDIVSGKSNIENIGVGAFIRIAHAFGTTADALANGVGDASITPDEQRLLDAFRKMEPDRRQLVLALLDYRGEAK